MIAVEQHGEGTVTTATAAAEFQTVVFRLGREYYALPIEQVHEIIRLQPVTRLPRTARFMEGIINLRGEVVPVIDLRKRFDLEAAESSETRIVVAEVGEVRMGMVVDAVTEVLRISRDVVQPPEAFRSLMDVEFMTGVAKLEDRLIVILDLEALFSVREQQAMARARQAG